MISGWQMVLSRLFSWRVALRGSKPEDTSTEKKGHRAQSAIGPPQLKRKPKTTPRVF